MSGFLLDTNIPSETLKPAPDPKVTRWLQSLQKGDQFISVVTLGELRRGATLLAPGARRAKLEHFINADLPAWFHPRILAVTQSIADIWGTLDAQRQLAGRPLNTADGMIAATALEHDLTLVTRNVTDFAGLSLTLLNPWEM